MPLVVVYFRESHRPPDGPRTSSITVETRSVRGSVSASDAVASGWGVAFNVCSLSQKHIHIITLRV